MTVSQNVQPPETPDCKGGLLKNGLTRHWTADKDSTHPYNEDVFQSDDRITIF